MGGGERLIRREHDNAPHNVEINCKWERPRLGERQENLVMASLIGPDCLERSDSKIWKSKTQP